MGYSITLTRTNSISGIKQTSEATYADQGKSDLDHIMIMCEALYDMVFMDNDNDGDDE
jgi:hypothetical protein